MTLIAVRFVDVAIFGTLGTLWIGGLVFIIALYRWIIRIERERKAIVPASSTAGVVRPESSAPVVSTTPRPRAALPNLTDAVPHRA